MERFREHRARQLWQETGAEAYYGPFPGLARASVILFRGANRAARRRLMRLFMSLPARWGAAAALGLLVVVDVLRPALQPRLVVDVPAPDRPISQRRRHRITPTRAP